MDGFIFSCRYLARVSVAVVGFSIAIFYMAFIVLSIIPACVLGTIAMVIWNSMFLRQQSLTSPGKRRVQGDVDAVKRAVVVDQENATVRGPIPPRVDGILPLPWQEDTGIVLPSSSPRLVRDMLLSPPTRQLVSSVLPPIPQYYFNINDPVLLGLPPPGIDRIIEIHQNQVPEFPAEPMVKEPSDGDVSIDQLLKDAEIRRKQLVRDAKLRGRLNSLGDGKIHKRLKD